MSSIFSRIIAGEIPCTKVYEDEHCIAILDINPVTKGHTLVIPKQEIEWLRQLPQDLLHHTMDVVQILMQAMIAKVWCDYVQIVVEWLEVPHTHIHLIPSFKEQKVAERQHITYQQGEQEEVANKIASYFTN